MVFHRFRREMFVRSGCLLCMVPSRTALPDDLPSESAVPKTDAPVDDAFVGVRLTFCRGLMPQTWAWLRQLPGRLVFETLPLKLK